MDRLPSSYDRYRKQQAFAWVGFFVLVAALIIVAYSITQDNGGAAFAVQPTVSQQSMITLDPTFVAVVETSLAPPPTNTPTRTPTPPIPTSTPPISCLSPMDPNTRTEECIKPAIHETPTAQVPCDQQPPRTIDVVCVRTSSGTEGREATK